jgi:hypothetical protein
MTEAALGGRLGGRGAAYAIGVGGLAAGSFDLAYAFIVSAIAGISPLIVSQYIASGLIGPASFAGGLPTALAGLLLHFLMAVLIAAIFLLASRKLPMLIERPLMWGVAYGLTVYVVMNYLVVPLSNVPSAPKAPQLPRLLGDLAIHAFGVGVPIVLAVRRYAGTPGGPQARRAVGR